ncbi:MAG: tellurium resistance protein [Pararhodobacter sp.]|nr:tellurium resistance protein [Pararhodobacter sp.]
MTDIKPRHFPPPPPAAPPGLWRQVPPAIFPPLMGLWGVGLGWRLLAARLGSEPMAGLAEAALGGITLLFVFALTAWLSKPLRRPAVLAEELRVLPGQAGVAAAALGVMLMAAALVPYAPALARVLAFAGMAFLALVGVLFLRQLAIGPAEARRVSPVFHLVLVGHVIAPLTLVPLGWTALSGIIVAITLILAAVIWLASLQQFLRAAPPAPLRPLLAIHAAPAALFSLVLSLLGWPAAALGFALAGIGFALLLAGAARWVGQAGYSPLWGALTFPLAALANAVLSTLPGGPGLWGGMALLLLATALTLLVAWRVLQAWVKGGLAARTNAAIV